MSKKINKITGKTTIAEVLQSHPEKLDILHDHFHAICLGCPMSQMETLEEASDHHEADLEVLLEELNSKE